MRSVVICGLGQLGLRIAVLLRRTGASVTVISIDHREDFAQDIGRLGIRLIQGDARNPKRLTDAGVDSADSVIVCTDDDRTNVEIAMEVSTVNPSAHLIVRLFDQTLSSAIEGQMGIDRILAVSRVAAPLYASAAVTQNVQHIFSFDGQNFVIDDQGQIRSHTPVRSLGFGKRVGRQPRPLLVPKLLWDSISLRLKVVAGLVLLIAIVSVWVFHQSMNLSLTDAFYYVVTTLTTVGYGDISPKDHSNALKLYACFLMLFGATAVSLFYAFLIENLVATQFRQMIGLQNVSDEDHVIVVGLGNVGFRVARELVTLGERVVTIDTKEHSPFRQLLPKEVLTLVGDGRDPKVLERAGIARARTLLALTNDDVVNLGICLAARKVSQNPLLIARIFDRKISERAKAELGVATSVSPPDAAAPIFAACALMVDSIDARVVGNELIIVRPGPEPARTEFTSVRLPLLPEEGA